MMKRFLMLVGVAVVAAAMYVAASPASQQAKGPTAKQFNALKKQVSTLSKTLKTVKAEAVDADGFVRSCILSSGAGVLPVNQFGAVSSGFLFGTTTTSAPRTALDVDQSATPGALLIAVDPACLQSTGTPHSGSSGLLLRRLRVR
jgi:hypothetical protein